MFSVIPCCVAGIFVEHLLMSRGDADEMLQEDYSSGYMLW